VRVGACAPLSVHAHYSCRGAGEKRKLLHAPAIFLPRQHERPRTCVDAFGCTYSGPWKGLMREPLRYGRPHYRRGGEGRVGGEREEVVVMVVVDVEGAVGK
jgi:hypothetical protein